MNEKLIEEVRNRAKENFRYGLNCGECVIRALIDTEGFDVPVEALKLSTGFGGGVGLYGSMCGALAAAVMAVSSVHGRDNVIEDDKSISRRELSIERAHELSGDQGLYRVFNHLIADFVQEYNTEVCRDIIKEHDFLTKDRALLCQGVIGESAALAAKWMLYEMDDDLNYIKSIKINKSDS